MYRLIQDGADPNAHTRHTFFNTFGFHQDSSWLSASNGETVLMLASRYGHMDFVKLFLKAGADPNQRDRGGRTALMFAVANGHIEVMEALVAAGADVTAHAKGCWGCRSFYGDSVLRSALDWSRLHNGDPALPLRVLARLKPGDLPNSELDACLSLYGVFDPDVLRKIEAMKRDGWLETLMSAF